AFHYCRDGIWLTYWFECGCSTAACEGHYLLGLTGVQKFFTDSVRVVSININAIIIIEITVSSQIEPHTVILVGLQEGKAYRNHKIIKSSIGWQALCKDRMIGIRQGQCVVIDNT